MKKQRDLNEHQNELRHYLHLSEKWIIKKENVHYGNMLQVKIIFRLLGKTFQGQSQIQINQG